MVKETDFYCQFVSYTNDKIARTTCGVTSMAIVLSAKGVFSKFQKSQRILDDFFTYINSLHKNDLPCVKRNMVFKDRTLPVTIGLQTQVEPQEGDFIEKDEEFFPAFVLYRGYDHRASEHILKYFGLEGKLYENASTLDIVSFFTEGRCEYFLPSIKSNFLNLIDKTASTHIVVVQKVYMDSNGVTWFEYVDPAIENFKEAVKTVSAQDFESIYNGFGTLVK